MKKQGLTLFNRAPDGAKKKQGSKSPRLNSLERRETQRQVITLIGWIIRLIIQAVKNRKNKEISK